MSTSQRTASKKDHREPFDFFPRWKCMRAYWRESPACHQAASITKCECVWLTDGGEQSQHAHASEAWQSDWQQREGSIGHSGVESAIYSPLYTLSVMVLTAILTMLSGWLKNLMASVYRAKSLVCWKHGRQKARPSTRRIRSERELRAATSVFLVYTKTNQFFIKLLMLCPWSMTNKSMTHETIQYRQVSTTREKQASFFLNKHKFMIMIIAELYGSILFKGNLKEISKCNFFFIIWGYE